MGSGIAQVAATSGQQVTIIDVDKDILKQSENIIKKSLNRVIKKKYADNQEVSVVTVIFDCTFPYIFGQRWIK